MPAMCCSRHVQPALPIVAREVQAVATEAFPSPTKRQRNSRLAIGKLQHRFGLQLPHWQAGVKRMLQETL